MEALPTGSMQQDFALVETPPVFDHLFLGVGAMKAGTTWNYDVLHRHPDIHFSREKEVHYFYSHYLRPGLLSDRNRMRIAKRHLGFDPEASHITPLGDRVRWTGDWLRTPVDDTWFNGLFNGRGTARWIADFSNLNALLAPEHWAEIHAKTATLRVLYTLRHPLQRLWSHVRFHLQMSSNACLLDDWSLDDVVAHIRDGAHVGHGDYLLHGDYVGALTRMRAALPPECIHVAWFDDIKTRPEAHVADIERFLGVAPNPVPEAYLGRVVNASKARAMPEGFAQAFAPEVSAQIDGLRAMGLNVPENWL